MKDALHKSLKRIKMTRIYRSGVPEFKLRYFSKREAREVSDAASRMLGRELTPLAELDSEGFALIVTREGLVLVGIPEENIYVPTLTDADSVAGIKGHVVVDEGAVRHVVNGANVMRPGIKEYTDFEAGDIVVVKEGVYGKPIAVGVALVPSRELASMSKGAVVRNVHHLRDGAWELLHDEDAKRLINKLVK
jgi:PUA domain protein